MASGAIQAASGPASRPAKDDAQMCAITLELPWSGSRDGSLTFRHGTEPSEVEEDQEFAFVGAAAQYAGQRAARVFRKGKPIFYGPMIAGDTQENTIHCPLSCAKQLFGDWTMPETADGDVNVMYTQHFEKRRVAGIWGDYQTKSHGINPDWKDIDATPIGPPNVPHVAVRLLDNRGGFKKNPDGTEFVYRPHDAYDYYTEFGLESPAKKVILPNGNPVRLDKQNSSKAPEVRPQG
jgi:hypothetical protein